LKSKTCKFCNYKVNRRTACSVRERRCAHGVESSRDLLAQKAVAESEEDPIIHTPFETSGEVDDYLSGETIPCLLCDARLQTFLDIWTCTAFRQPNIMRGSISLSIVR
jgi:hypothetical protein